MEDKVKSLEGQVARCQRKITGAVRHRDYATIERLHRMVESLKSVLRIEKDRLVEIERVRRSRDEQILSKLKVGGLSS